MARVTVCALKAFKAPGTAAQTYNSGYQIQQNQYSIFRMGTVSLLSYNTYSFYCYSVLIIDGNREPIT